MRYRYSLPLRDLLLLPLLVAIAGILTPLLPTRLSAQGIGIENGFPFTADPTDTVPTRYLPTAYDGPAGAHGFVEKDAEGNLLFQDGTPVRFVGVTIQTTAAFPDSAAAIVEAARLRKLGINLVRFRYTDFSYDWAEGFSWLDRASGFRSLNAEQIGRFDWFVHQLKQNGIYVTFPLLSARAPRPEDGLSADQLDSMLWIGQGMHFLYPQARAAHKHVARLILDHVNPYTGKAYKEEPAVAMIETLHRQSPLIDHALGRDISQPIPSGLSWDHTRRLDTLFNAWLGARYGSTAGVRNAWTVPTPPGGNPNLVSEGSFEGIYDSAWVVNNNAINVSQILSQDSVPDGRYALMLRVRNANGNVYDAGIWQFIRLDFDKIYQIKFKARTSNPEGRSIVAAVFGAGGDLSPSLFNTVQITSYWQEYTVPFAMPVRNSNPLYLYFFFGDKDGEVVFDDVEVSVLPSVALVDGESVETSTVQRIPWGNNAFAFVSSQRVKDQTAFYLDLTSGYFNDLRRFVSDTVGARQLVAGNEHLWASTFLDAAVQKEADLTMAAHAWDWVSSENGSWMIRNYSPLRIGWAGPIYSFAASAHEGQPFVASFSTPNPNRYQAESALQTASYLLLQDWDGLIWDTYDEDKSDQLSGSIDSANWTDVRNNPVITSLMPAISQIIRNGLIAPAETTFRLQHSGEQLELFSRYAGSWGNYSVPGGLYGYGPAVSRVVIDSMNAREFTQANDFQFEGQATGEVLSDTREIRWEYARGLITVNAPKVQAISGAIGVAGRTSLDALEVRPLSLNETATIIWVPLDPETTLDMPGQSLLTVVTRSEPTGWVWQDTITASVWGGAPMVVEPVRAEISFTFDEAVQQVAVQPLDASGLPFGEPITLARSGNDFSFTLNQSQTSAIWFAVNASDDLTDVDEAVAGEAFRLVGPNVFSETGAVTVRMPRSDRGVDVALFDLLGRRVATLFNGPLPAGSTPVQVPADDLRSGAYVVRAAMADGEATQMPVRIVR